MNGMEQYYKAERPRNEASTVADLLAGLTTGAGDDVTGTGDDLSEVVCHVLGGEGGTASGVLMTGSSVEDSTIFCTGEKVCVYDAHV